MQQNTTAQPAPGTPRGRYRVSDLAATFGLSRTTLLYYERLGIVEPHRDDESGYRYYTDAEVFRLMGAVLLKNVGVAPKELGGRLRDEPFSARQFDRYIQYADHQAEYYRAQKECLEELARLRDIERAPEIATVEPYYIMFDTAETGYRDFPDDSGLTSLIDNIPISSFGACYETDTEGAIRPRWGRTIPVRLAHLVPDPPVDLPIIGGCRCVQQSMVSHDITRSESGVEALEKLLDELRLFGERHGYAPAGDAFAPRSLPSDQEFCSLVCLPVRPVSLSARIGTALDSLLGRLQNKTLGCTASTYATSARGKRKSS